MDEQGASFNMPLDTVESETGGPVNFLPLRPVDSDSPFKSIQKHPRYCSDWGENIIVIDKAPKGQPFAPMIIDLGAVILPANAPAGRYEKPFPLTDLKNWVDAIKTCINTWLYSIKDGSSVSVAISKRFNHLIHFCEFCVCNQRYSFDAVTYQDVEKLLNGLRAAGWYSALTMQERYERLIAACLQNRQLLNEFIDLDSSHHTLHIRLHAVSNWLGINIERKTIPSFVYLKLAELAGIQLKGKIGIEQPNMPRSERYFDNLFSLINTVSAIPAGFDRLSFCPFPQPTRDAQRIGKENGRTENLSLEDAIRMLTVALKGIYDWAPGIIEMGCEIRETIQKWISEGVSKHRIAKRLPGLLSSLYPRYQKQYGFPFRRLSGVASASRTDPEPTYLDLLKLIMSCCAVMTGINHGRRKNEIIGEGGLPYGLYFGCVKTVNGELQQFRLDIYVEKTVQDWQEFWCNKLVADSVKILENIQQLFRPLGSPEIDGQYAERDMDKKLFQFRPLTLNGLESEPCAFLFNDHSDLFFQLANVEKKALEQKTHVFRRFFALIYYYRYDHAALQALSDHLKHLNLDTTRIYITEPSFKAEGDRIQSLYLQVREENAGQEAAEAQVGSEYFLKIIKEIIEGNPASGNFSKHVLRVYSVLSRQVDFSELDQDERAAQIRDRFAGKGYTPRPMRHGVCNAGNSRSKARGKCFSHADNRLHKEQASIETCSKCMFHFCNPSYLANLEVDLANLRARAVNADGEYTLAEQMVAETEANNLAQLIADGHADQQWLAERMVAIQSSSAICDTEVSQNDSQ